MNRRRVFIWSLLFLFVSASFVLGLIIARDPEEVPPPEVAEIVEEEIPYVVETEIVLAANTYINSGSFIKPSQIIAVNIEKSDMPEGALSSEYSAEDIIGAIAKYSINKGVILSTQNVSMPNERLGGFLARTIDKDMRAITIIANISDAVRNIFPGDYVDVIAVNEQAQDSNVALLADGALVLAKDLRITKGVTSEDFEPEITIESEGFIETVLTIQVTPKQAKLIALVENMLGQESVFLSLHSEKYLFDSFASENAEIVTDAFELKKKLFQPFAVRKIVGSGEDDE